MTRTMQLLLLVSIFLVATHASAPDVHSVVRSPRNKIVESNTSSEKLAFYRPQSEASPALVPYGGGAVVATKKSTITISQKTAVIVGLLLAFNSGYMNGVCLNGFFQSTKQAVAAMTGSYTNSALFLAGGNTAAFWAQMRVLGGYILGNAIAGYMNPKPVLFEVGPSVGPAMLLAGGALAAASTQFKDSKWLFAFAAIANGIQNSVTSVHTANLCRTSHYTGISSDMGTFLGQCLGGNTANLMKLKVFFGLACCFWAGGYLSFFTANHTGLWASAEFYGLLGLGLMFASWKQQQPAPQVVAPPKAVSPTKKTSAKKA